MNQVVLSTVLQIFNNGVKLFTGIVIAYYLGTSKSMDSYVIASGFIISMSGLLINTQSSSLIPFISKYEDESKRLGFISKILRFNVLFIGLSAVFVSVLSEKIVVVLAPGVESSVHSTAGRLLRYLSYLLLLSSFIAVGEAVLDYYKKYVTKYVLNLLRSTSILVIVLLLIGNYSLQGIVCAHLLSALLPVFYYVWFYRSKNIQIIKSLIVIDNEVSIYLGLLLPVVFSWFFVWIIKFSDTFLASWMGEGKIAYLNYCQKITMYSGVLTAALSSIYFARLSKLAKGESGQEYFKVFTDGFLRLVIVSLLISTIVIACAPYIIGIMFERGEFSSADTHAVAEVLRYYILVIFCAPLGGYLSNVYFSYKKPKYATLFSIISSVSNVALNLLLGKIMGVTGLALASSLAFCVGVVLQFSNLKKVNEFIDYQHVLKQLVYPVIICLVSALGALGGLAYVDQYIDNIYVLFAVFLLLFFFCFLILASFNKELRKLAMR